MWRSSAEGISLPLIESMAHGLPCVATGHPNHMELMGDLCVYPKTEQIMPSAWSFEYLPDPEDAARLADGVLDWDPDARRRHAERARRRFAERHSVEALARELKRYLP